MQQIQSVRASFARPIGRAALQAETNAGCRKADPNKKPRGSHRGVFVWPDL